MERGAVNDEIRKGRRFAFGANWAEFLKGGLDQSRVDSAKRAIQVMLGIESLEGKRFLDAGCGSGIHSLAASLLGAKVVSFDFDPDSVNCSMILRERFVDDAVEWRIVQGSVMDRRFLDSLGLFDIVYSWGVLHHTGALWEGIDNITGSVAAGGLLFLSVYNDQGWLRLENH